MKTLMDVNELGAVDADADNLLEQCFEDHEAYLNAKSHKKFLIIGRKGSGKTAIYRKLLREKSYSRFSFGHDFTDYPWHLHNHQAVVGVPDEQKFFQSWRYLILMTLSKILLNQDHSQPYSDEAMESLAKVERFVADTYGTLNPDVAQIFSPVRKLRFKSSFEITWPVKMTLNAEGVPMSELPSIVQEVNRNLVEAVVSSVNPDFDYYVCFDQLDLGFENSETYKSRLIGLLLAAREINVKAAEKGKKLSILVFLRDDIYQLLSFEDKNKITQNYVSRIEWDTQRTARTLKQLMEKRLAVVLEVPEEGAWEKAFDEDEKMTGRQNKYQHMLDRTFLRPRDMIKFTNEVLAAYKRHRTYGQDSEFVRFRNKDVQAARYEYSSYLLSEIDDEIPKHYPDYQKYIEILKSMESLQFTLEDFQKTCERRKAFLPVEANPLAILMALFQFSLIGYYALGGGTGGSEYVYKYKDPTAQFNEAASSYRIHAGLKEVLGVKNYVRSDS
ncbi:MAG TPA: hypothetical protein VNY74_02785 [Edaphobacter sp.]|jgi:hypothetical protein|nr:hypothetical protein [Edaphobacter sp.]